MKFVFKVYISCKPVNHQSKSEADVVVAYQRSLCLIFQTLMMFSCQQKGAFNRGGRGCTNLT